MSHPILGLTAWQNAVFLLNSRLGHFTAAWQRQAPLIPKLRGQFAEFLNQGSLLRLGIFYPPTCVGLRYGRPWKGVQRFSRRSNQETEIGSPRTLLPLSIGMLSQIPRTRTLTKAGAGILTCCASPTPSGLDLAPD